MKYELRINLPNLSTTLSGNSLEEISAAAQKIEALAANPLDLPKIDPSMVEPPLTSPPIDKEAAAPVEPEWIEWNGGECPVRNGADVEVRFRDGGIDRDSMPEYCRNWYHEGTDDDIVAYRVFP